MFLPGQDVYGVGLELQVRAMQTSFRQFVAKQKGGFCLHKLKQLFQQIDNNGNNRLDLDEFEMGLTKFGFFLKKHEYKLLFNHFDANKDGTLDYQEFIDGITIPLNERRLTFVNKIFKILDLDQSGAITIEEIATRLDFSNHSEYIWGRKTLGDLISEYMAPFETVAKDNKITEEEFIKYYTDLSLSIPSDDHFIEILEKLWKIPEKEQDMKIIQAIQQLVDDLRQKLLQMACGSKDILTFRKIYDKLDKNEDGYISFQEFEKMIKNFKINFTFKILTIAFYHINKTRTGSIDFDEFQALLLRDPLQDLGKSTRRLIN